jgi:beta-1,4-mannosyltransferase
MRVAIIVMGDFGRSPRMQYQALALADEGAAVDVIAYQGCAPFREVIEQPKIRLHLIADRAVTSRSGRAGPVFIASSALRLFVQTLRLLWLLLVTLDRPDIFLVQNPPALPAMAVTLLAARLRSAKLMIDWHNFSHSMLALSLGREHWAVRMLRRYEQILGPLARGHLCVSRAMQLELDRNWRIPAAVVLYDRPAGMFSATRESRSVVLSRVLRQLSLPMVDAARRAVIVSPTSWTLDEEIPILIEAARLCDRMIQDLADGVFTDVLILITGQGPGRARSEDEIARLALKKFHLRTLWLEAEDYVQLLGAADLGVCCHRSASGVDLPMKISDMFGAGIPVCALDYGPCLTELVRNGENGLLFKGAEQLAAQFYELFAGFPAPNALLNRLRANVLEQRKTSWRDGWKKEAASLFAG